MTASDFRSLLRDMVKGAAIRKAGAVPRESLALAPAVLTRAERRDLRLQLRRHAGNATKAAGTFPDRDQASFRERLRILKDRAEKRRT